MHVRREEIKIKGEDEPYILEVKSTHRGPLMSNEILSGADVLFAESIPTIHKDDYYSLAWTGHVDKENTIQILRGISKTKSV